MYECIELRCTLAVLPTPQGPAVSPMSIPCMLDGTEDFVNVDVVPAIIRFLDDMPETEAEKYVKARELKAEEIKIQKAEAAGITLSSKMPEGGQFGGSSRR